MVRKDDCDALIRVASNLPPRDATRRAILSSLSRGASRKVEETFGTGRTTYEVEAYWSDDDMAILREHLISKYNPGDTDPTEADGDARIQIQHVRDEFLLLFHKEDSLVVSWSKPVNLVKPTNWCVFQIPEIEGAGYEQEFVKNWGNRYFNKFRINEIDHNSVESQAYLTSVIPKGPVPGLMSASLSMSRMIKVPKRVIKKVISDL